MTGTTDRDSAPQTKGWVLHWPALYDFKAWLHLRGRERAFRERLADLARLQPGQSVLDIGCGTGSQAIAAKRRVGPSGKVQGVDPSPEMIARARKKARKAGVDVTFATGAAESLPIPDAQFDVVLCTLVMHHLPGEVRAQGARAIRRLLRPGGRALIVDRAMPAGGHHHDAVDLPGLIALLRESGLDVVESGAVGVRNLSFVVVQPR